MTLFGSLSELFLSPLITTAVINLADCPKKTYSATVFVRLFLNLWPTVGDHELALDREIRFFCYSMRHFVVLERTDNSKRS